MIMNINQILCQMSCHWQCFFFLEWVLCSLYSTLGYKNTQLFCDTLMMISKINKFPAKIWIILLAKISTSSDEV